MKRKFNLSAFVCIILASGCGGPSTLEKPKLEPAVAAAAAMEMYDKDKDGQLSKSELRAVPAIQDSLELYDTDGNNRVSQDEIQQRFELFLAREVALLNRDCVITNRRGQPLVNAEVELTPEPFLEGVFMPAYGVTDETGRATMAVDPADMPDDAPAGFMQYGLYKVRVTHDSINIPPKYNTETELGMEVSPAEADAPAEKVFRLSI